MAIYFAHVVFSMFLALWVLTTVFPKSMSSSPTDQNFLVESILVTTIHIQASHGRLYGDHWQNLRRISALEILSPTRLDSLSHIRLDEIRSLIRRLFLSVGKNPDMILNLRSEFVGFMFNAMSKMIGGKRYYGMDIGKVVEAKRFRDVLADINQVNSQSNTADMWQIFRWLVGGKLEKRYAAVQKRRDEFMQECIDEFRADGLDDEQGKKTLLQVLLSLQHADPEYYTDKEIKSLSQALLHGGINTSVEAMEWAMSPIF